MPRFFTEKPTSDIITITGEDAKHISRSLRMETGEQLTVCDGCGTDYQCEIASVCDTAVILNIIKKSPCITEPSVRVTLYQGLPKGEKFDTVVQKSVELGVTTVSPIIMERSISRPDSKCTAKKTERWQKISNEAAKQCGRGILPTVNAICDFKSAIADIAKHELILVCYEGGGISPTEIIKPDYTDMAVVIGPEGGISDAEIAALKQAGAQILTLGTRILRTETAPVCALSVIMLLTGNM